MEIEYICSSIRSDHNICPMKLSYALILALQPSVLQIYNDKIQQRLVSEIVLK